jgi:hypothetical protein
MPCHATGANLSVRIGSALYKGLELSKANLKFRVRWSMLCLHFKWLAKWQVDKIAKYGEKPVWRLILQILYFSFILLTSHKDMY